MPECEITGRLDGKKATRADYEALFDPCERPHKFSAEEVGFVIPTNGKRTYSCFDCRHWFTNRASGRLVCEIMRLPGEKPVPASGVCRFWNVDGKFPLLKVL